MVEDAVVTIARLAVATIAKLAVAAEQANVTAAMVATIVATTSPKVLWPLLTQFSHSSSLPVDFCPPTSVWE